MNGDNLTVPPPPPAADTTSSLADVTIRTMASDIDAILRGGGALIAPKVETVSTAKTASRSNGTLVTVAWVAVGLFLAGFLFWLGYSYLPLLFPKNTPAPAAPAAPAPAPSLPSAGTAPVFLGHTSFLRILADATVNVAVPSPNDRAGEGYASRLTALLKSLDAAKQFVEVRPTDTAGGAVGWPGFSSLVGAAIIDPEFFGAHFEKDFTFFAFRAGGNAIWPGYIMKLKDGETPATVGPVISSVLEGVPVSLGNLFLLSPGNATGTFSEFQVVGQPVRMLNFTTPGAAVVYGWFFNKYLVISTSEAGLREAVRRL